MAKTTKADFEKFRNYCEHWRRVFGIQDYQFGYLHDVLAIDSYAECRANAEGRSVRITLGTTWKNVPAIDEEQLNRTALHEMLHVVLNLVSDLAMCRCIIRSEFETAEEAAVVRLENGIFEIMKGR